MENIEDRARAIRALKSGEVVLHPTGSLYGLAADAYNAEAIQKVKSLKRLEEGARPFVVLISKEWVENLVALERMNPETRKKARTLVREYWPGGLTLIVPASEAAPRYACAQSEHGPTIAIRADDHPAAIELCNGFGGPLVSTSANLHGTPSPLKLSDVPEAIKEGTTLFHIEPVPEGSASTVLDLTRLPPRVLREGRIPQRELL